MSGGVFVFRGLTSFSLCTLSLPLRRASDHRNISDPRDADTTLGAKGDSTFAHKNELAGGQGVSVGGGEGTGTNETLAGGVKGTGGMGKRDGENAMGGGGGMVGEYASRSCFRENRE